MKTIIWKELRENLKWAALAFFVLALGEIGTMHQHQDDSIMSYNGVTICSAPFLMVTSFGCAVVGAALAALQIVPELRRDQWAALLHRPVPRQTIFFGKVVAGLILYFAATGLPFLLCIAYAAAPGQFAVPFVPGMIIPGASDILLGMAAYFTALLVALSRGPWYGRRALLAISFVLSFLSHMSGGWIFSVPVVAGIVMMAAACGAMLGNGTPKDRPLPGRLGFVFALYLGVQAAVVILLFASGLVLSRNHAGVFRRFELTSDGQVFISAYHTDGSGTTMTQLDGTPVTDERYIGNINGNFFSQFVPLTWELKISPAREFRNVNAQPRNGQTYVMVANEDDNGSPETWFLLVRKNYFVGYDKLSRRCIGICDAEGFHPPDATPKPFPVRLQSATWNMMSPYIYWSGTHLYAFDFSERNMLPLPTKPGDRIYGANLITPNYRNALFFAASLDSGIQIFDMHGKPLVLIPYGHDPTKWSQVSVATLPTADRLFVSYSRGGSSVAPPPSQARLPSFVDEVDFQGSVVHTYQATFEQVFPDTGWMVKAGIAATPLLPAALFVAYGSVTAPEDFAPINDPTALREFLIGGAIVLGVSIVLAICTWFWARRMGFSHGEATRWALFVFGFGLAGFITFRLSPGWPTRVRCPQCSRKRSITTEKCPECHEGWPEPARTGSEILAVP